MPMPFPGAAMMVQPPGHSPASSAATSSGDVVTAGLAASDEWMHDAIMHGGQPAEVTLLNTNVPSNVAPRHNQII